MVGSFAPTPLLPYLLALLLQACCLSLLYLVGAFLLHDNFKAWISNVYTSRGGLRKFPFSFAFRWVGNLCITLSLYLGVNYFLVKVKIVQKLNKIY